MKTKLPIVAGVLVLLGVVAYVGAKNMRQQAPSYVVPGIVPTITQGVGTETSSGTTTGSKSSELTLSVTSPADRATVTSASLTVRGKTAPSAEVFVNDAETKADAAGNFSVRITLDEGENAVIVLVNDAEGRVAEKDLTITYNSGQ